jgi:hypothetical protein
MWNGISILTINGCYFEGNSAENGGSFYLNDLNLELNLKLSNSVFVKNEAVKGIDIYMNSTIISLTTGEISNCRSNSLGIRLRYGGGEVGNWMKLLPDSHKPTCVDGAGEDDLFCGSVYMECAHEKPHKLYGCETPCMVSGRRCVWNSCAEQVRILLLFANHCVCAVSPV